MKYQTLEHLLRGADPKTLLLPDRFPHPQGDIAVRILESKENDVNILVRLRAGSAYIPDAHRYVAQIQVLSGTGDFFLDRNVRLYGPGDIYLIAPGEKHAFAWVDEDTLFLYHAEDVGAQKN